MNILILIGVFLASVSYTNSAPFLAYAQIPKSQEEYDDGYFFIEKVDGWIDKFRQIYTNLMKFDRIFQNHDEDKSAYFFRHY